MSLCTIIADNDFTSAIESLKLVISQDKYFAGGGTTYKAVSLLIILRLLTEYKTSYSHLNPLVRKLIEYQSEEVVQIFDINLSEEKKLELIYKKKILRFIEVFNAEGYCHYIIIPFKK